MNTDLYVTLYVTDNKGTKIGIRPWDAEFLHQGILPWNWVDLDRKPADFVPDALALLGLPPFYANISVSTRDEYLRAVDTFYENNPDWLDGRLPLRSARKCENKKGHFISMLKHFSTYGGKGIYDPIYDRPDYQPEWRGDRALACGLAKYLEAVPGDVEGINWYTDLADHLVDAFEEFRTLEKWEGLRREYAFATEGNEIPDLVNCHIDPIRRSLVANSMTHLVTVLAGETWLQSKLEAVFHAQQECIDLAWRRFVRVCYREMMPRIAKERHRGNRGKFGSTVLLTYDIAGRTVFTFRRGEGDGPSVSYVADSSDMWGVRSGGNFATTPYRECISMIEEVTDNWSLDEMKECDSVLLV